VGHTPGVLAWHQITASPQTFAHAIKSACRVFWTTSIASCRSFDAYPLPDISSVFQCTGHCNVVTVVDCKAGYWQIPMLEEYKWLTAFVCDAGLFRFNPAPFGLKGSGNTFVHAMNVMLSSLRKFMGSFANDVAVHSHQRKGHLDRFLAIGKKYGLKLSLRKCRFAQSQVKFCGEITGAGKRFTDPESCK